MGIHQYARLYIKVAQQRWFCRIRYSGGNYIYTTLCKCTVFFSGNVLISDMILLCLMLSPYIKGCLHDSMKRDVSAMIVLIK